MTKPLTDLAVEIEVGEVGEGDATAVVVVATATTTMVTERWLVGWWQENVSLLCLCLLRDDR